MKRMFGIPSYILYFVLGGIVLLLLVIPIRMVWLATRGSREREGKLRDFADRLKEKFREVAYVRGAFGYSGVRFQHEDRTFSMAVPSDRRALLKIEGPVHPAFHIFLREKRWTCLPWKFLWESLQLLRRFRIHDPLIDDDIALYSSGAFAAYLHDLVQKDIPAEGKPEGVAESLVVLSKLPGVRSFRITMSPSAGLRLHLRFRTEDLFYRPEEMESAAHHLAQLYNVFVMI